MIWLVLKYFDHVKDSVNIATGQGGELNFYMLWQCALPNYSLILTFKYNCQNYIITDF